MPEIQMPKLSDTMTEGTLVAWKKKKGDKVSAGEVIAEIETDKATMEWESPEDGTLTEIYVEEGGKVNVGDKIAFIGEEGEAAPAEEEERREARAEGRKKRSRQEESAGETEKPAPPKKKEKKPRRRRKAKSAKPSERKEEAPPKPASRRSRNSEEARVKASPLARRVAAELGVDLSASKAPAPKAASPKPMCARRRNQRTAPRRNRRAAAACNQAGEGARINLSGMRKVIAERLVASKGPVPHFYLNIEIDAGPLMAARAELKSAGEGADAAKITVNDFVLKAAVEAAVQSSQSERLIRWRRDRAIRDVDLGDRRRDRRWSGHAGHSRGAKQVAPRNQ